MADHFADRYWSTAFWPVRYFQGGEQPAGAMRASLSGAASVTAGLSSAEVAGAMRASVAGAATVTAALSSANIEVAVPGVGGGHRVRRRVTPYRPRVFPLPIPAMMNARVMGTSAVTASATATAEAQSRITGSSNLSATGGTIDVYAREAEFWLMAA